MLEFRFKSRENPQKISIKQGKRKSSSRIPNMSERDRLELAPDISFPIESPLIQVTRSKIFLSISLEARIPFVQGETRAYANVM